MNKEELRRRVDEIIKDGNADPERGHGDEDGLMEELIDQFCPNWVNDELRRLRAANFPRWYA